MDMHLKNKDVRFVLTVAVLIAGMTSACWLVIGPPAVIVGLGLTIGAILAVVIEIYRRLPFYFSAYHDRTEARAEVLFRQTEALLSLYATLKPSYPLASTRRWAASPDFLLKLSELILFKRPDFVLELGSGVSTVVAASCLRLNGKGKLISLDDDPDYAQATRNALMLHDLANIAEVVHAPLRETQVNGATQPWYDIGRLKLDCRIDLLVIDGPQLSVGKLARYPALPLLADKLSDDAVIMLDDAIRQDEKQVVAQWQKEFQDKIFRYIEMEKGAYIISKNPVYPATDSAS